MKYEITKDRIEEIACCIVDNELDRDEACDYALATLRECMADDAEEAEEATYQSTETHKHNRLALKG